MRSSTLLALTAAFGPLAVLSSPHPPPPVWEIEIITISFDDAQLYRPPGRSATATTSSSGASITSGTEKDESGDDECENEGSPSSTTSAVGANPLAGGAGNNSLPTTLSTVVADKFRRQDTIGSEPPNTIGDKLRRQENPATTAGPDAQATLNAQIAAVENLLPLGNLRRQVEDLSSSTTSAAVAGVYPPAGFGGTDYPTPTSSMSAVGGSVKKLKNCAKGPVKLKGGNASLSGSSFTDGMPAATSMSSAAMSMSSAAMSTSSAAMSSSSAAM